MGEKLSNLMSDEAFWEWLASRVTPNQLSEFYRYAQMINDYFVPNHHFSGSVFNEMIQKTASLVRRIIQQDKYFLKRYSKYDQNYIINLLEHMETFITENKTQLKTVKTVQQPYTQQETTKPISSEETPKTKPESNPINTADKETNDKQNSGIQEFRKEDLTQYLQERKYSSYEIDEISARILQLEDAAKQLKAPSKKIIGNDRLKARVTINWLKYKVKGTNWDKPGIRNTIDILLKYIDYAEQHGPSLMQQAAEPEKPLNEPLPEPEPDKVTDKSTKQTSPEEVIQVQPTAVNEENPVPKRTLNQPDEVRAAFIAYMKAQIPWQTDMLLVSLDGMEKGAGSNRLFSPDIDDNLQTLKVLRYRRRKDGSNRTEQKVMDLLEKFFIQQKQYPDWTKYHTTGTENENPAVISVSEKVQEEIAEIRKTESDAIQNKPELSSTDDSGINSPYEIVNFADLGIYSFCQPVSVRYFGRKLDVDSWRYLYVTLCSTLRLEHPTVFEKLREESLHGIGGLRLVDEAHKNDLITANSLGGGYFIEVNRNATDLIRNLKYVLDRCGVNYHKVVIEYIRKEAKEEKVNDINEVIRLALEKLSAQTSKGISAESIAKEIDYRLKAYEIRPILKHMKWAELIGFNSYRYVNDEPLSEQNKNPEPEITNTDKYSSTTEEAEQTINNSNPASGSENKNDSLSQAKTCSQDLTESIRQNLEQLSKKMTYGVSAAFIANRINEDKNKVNKILTEAEWAEETPNGMFVYSIKKAKSDENNIKTISTVELFREFFRNKKMGEYTDSYIKLFSELEQIARQESHQGKYQLFNCKPQISRETINYLRNNRAGTNWNTQKNRDALDWFDKYLDFLQKEETQQHSDTGSVTSVLGKQHFSTPVNQSSSPAEEHDQETSINHDESINKDAFWSWLEEKVTPSYITELSSVSSELDRYLKTSNIFNHSVFDELLVSSFDAVQKQILSAPDFHLKFDDYKADLITKYIEFLWSYINSPNQSNNSEQADGKGIDLQKTDRILNLDEPGNLSYTTPTSIHFYKDNISSIKNWDDVYVQFLSVLDILFPDFLHSGMIFDKESGMVDIRNENHTLDLKSWSRIPYTTLFARTDGTAYDYLTKMKYLLDMKKIPYDKLTITYRYNRFMPYTPPKKEVKKEDYADKSFDEFRTFLIGRKFPEDRIREIIEQLRLIEKDSISKKWVTDGFINNDPNTALLLLNQVDNQYNKEQTWSLLKTQAITTYKLFLGHKTSEINKTVKEESFQEPTQTNETVPAPVFMETSDAPTSQPRWTLQEAAVLLDAYLKVREHPEKRKELVQQVSDQLRQMAINQGMQISDTYRNYAGINMQIYGMETAWTGRKPDGHIAASKVFTLVVELYRDNHDEYINLLSEAQRLCEKPKAPIIIKKETFRKFLDKKELSTYTQVYYCACLENMAGDFRETLFEQDVVHCLSVIKKIKEKITAYGTASSKKEALTFFEQFIAELTHDKPDERTAAEEQIALRDVHINNANTIQPLILYNKN